MGERALVNRPHADRRGRRSVVITSGFLNCKLQPQRRQPQVGGALTETGSFKDVEGIVLTPQERFSQGISTDEKEVKVWISEGNYIAAFLTYKQSQQYLKMLEDGADGMLVRITSMENRSVKILGAFHRDDGKATPKQ